MSTPKLMDFDQFVTFIRKHAIRDFCDKYNPNYDDEYQAKKGPFANETAIEQLLPMGDDYRNTGGYSERSHFGNLLGFLDPYSVLRVIAENPANLDLDVVWDYGNFVAAGWAQNGDFIAGARRTQTYLIATEGTSDIHILKHAIAQLPSTRP